MEAFLRQHIWLTVRVTVPAGQKPLVIRYQSGTATQPSSSATAEGGDASAVALQRRGSLGAADPSEPAKAPPPRTAR